MSDDQFFLGINCRIPPYDLIGDQGKWLIQNLSTLIRGTPKIDIVYCNSCVLTILCKHHIESVRTLDTLRDPREIRLSWGDSA